MNYEIAIPSYNRTAILSSHTLSMLESFKIPHSILTVFVASAEEEVKYREVVPATIRIVVGEKGVRAIRNIITNHYPEDAWVVSIDDDIDGFVECVSTKERRPVTDLDAWIRTAFQECVKKNYNLWGIYPMNNPFYSFKLKPMSQDRKFCIGHFFGVINKKVTTHIDYKEDYERSIRYTKRDGGVIRFNHISAVTKFGRKGGVDKTAKERLPVYKKEIEYLVAEFPNIIRLNPKREGEILLKSKVLLGQ